MNWTICVFSSISSYCSLNSTPALCYISFPYLHLFLSPAPSLRFSAATFLYANEAKPVVPVLTLQDTFANTFTSQEKQDVDCAPSFPREPPIIKKN